jgi:hypothetical protein
MFDTLAKIKEQRPAFFKELIQDILLSTNLCSQQSYYEMRALYRETRGAFNEEASQIYSLFRPKEIPKPDHGILLINEAKNKYQGIDQGLQALHQEGIYKFPSSLSSESISLISEYVMNAPELRSRNGETISGKQLLSERNFGRSRYEIPTEGLLQLEAVQDIILDPSFLYLAQEYLGCNPILDNVSAWCSVPLGKLSTKEKMYELNSSAQKFHYDMDRIKFLKVFIYLDEVNNRNGPFTYVKTSHQDKPLLLEDRRYEDEEIHSFYKSEKILEMCGDAGSIFACDTSGFHKGKPVESGFRIVFQLEYSISLFGAEYKAIDVTKVGDSFAQRMSAYRKSFAGFFMSPDVLTSTINKKTKASKFKGAPYEEITYTSSQSLNKYYSKYVFSRKFKWKSNFLTEKSNIEIFTIGSCFANELRAYLQKKSKIKVHPYVSSKILNTFHDMSKEVSSWGKWDGSSNLQYYNTFSIKQEIEKAAGLWKQDIHDFWSIQTERKGVVFQDPYRRRIFANSLENIFKLSQSIDNSIKTGLSKADIVILTLGLTEVWIKKDNGMVACCEPGYCGGGGFTETNFHASTFLENYNNISTSIDILLKIFNVSHIIITVSPIPLGRTFRDADVFCANVESKSILRAVASEVSNNHERVHYFPSYEMTVFDKNSFLDDGRHIKESKVKQIMDFFEQIHLPDLKTVNNK